MGAGGSRKLNVVSCPNKAATHTLWGITCGVRPNNVYLSVLAELIALVMMISISGKYVYSITVSLSTTISYK
jgi:hypothetical protein